MNINFYERLHNRKMSQDITEEYHEFDLDSNLENVFDSQNSQESYSQHTQKSYLTT